MAHTSFGPATLEAVQQLVDTLVRQELPQHDRIVRALQDIINWNPESRPLQFNLKHSVYAGMSRSARLNKEHQHELDGDAQCQFVSESYLYNLLGKDAARSLLSRFRSLATALGVADMYTLYEDCPGCGRAKCHSGSCVDPADDKKRRQAGMRELVDDVAKERS